MRREILRTSLIPALVLLASCVSVEQIQKTTPVRTMTFTGSHKAVAQCVHLRVGGKVQDENFGEKYIVYDSVKGQQDQGLTHYAITFARMGADQGIAEWRVYYPETRSGRDMPADRTANRGGKRSGKGRLSDAAVQRYWAPVEDCVAEAKRI